MSLLSDLFGDGSLLDKLQSPPQWTATTHPDDREAVELLKTVPIDAIQECVEAFEQWYDEYRIGWDVEAIAQVRAWVAQVVDFLNREGERLGG